MPKVGGIFSSKQSCWVAGWFVGTSWIPHAVQLCWDYGSPSKGARFGDGGNRTHQASPTSLPPWFGTNNSYPSLWVNYRYHNSWKYKSNATLKLYPHDSNLLFFCELGWFFVIFCPKCHPSENKEHWPCQCGQSDADRDCSSLRPHPWQTSTPPFAGRKNAPQKAGCFGANGKNK